MILTGEEKPKEPYRHQDYPRVVYGPNRATQTVKDEAAEKELGKEWTRKPHPPLTEEPEAPAPKPKGK
jgi:hypothetical protein